VCRPAVALLIEADLKHISVDHALFSVADYT
jgi:hypothetical protein